MERDKDTGWSAGGDARGLLGIDVVCGERVEQGREGLIVDACEPNADRVGFESGFDALRQIQGELVLA